tara:strand:+ start:1031 stop:2857 length:1827 start_codon:yes stop_codon:yes gene_type:complete
MNQRKITNYLVSQNRSIKKILVIINDAILVTMAFLIMSQSLGEIFRFDFYYILFLSISGILFFYNKIYDNVIQNIGIRYISKIIILIGISFLSYFLLAKFIFNNHLLGQIIFYSSFLSFFLIIFSRLSARFILYENIEEKEKIILYTDYDDIGEAVNLAANSVKYKLVGIISSTTNNKGGFIDGIEILPIKDTKKLALENKVSKLFIASDHDIKNLDSDLFNIITSFPIQVFKIPNLKNIIARNDSFNNLQNLSLEDFIVRKVDNEIKLNDKDNQIIKDKTVLITGAGGSIGSVLAKQIIINKPKLLIILDHSEAALFKIHLSLESMNLDVKIVTKLINLSDRNLTRSVFKDFKIDTIYHAAAYKHVNILENELKSAINNNILGTYYLMNQCYSNGIKNFVLISTDKAVKPSTIMGRTKKFCELIVQYFQNKDKNNNYVAVRFGNVFNSSGSVIQIFKDQISKNQDLTVTDKNVTRFFMSIEEAVKLVIQASVIGKGGEIFVLEMGEPIKIIDIAERMIYLSGKTIKSESNPSGDIGIKFTGLKQGEKLHEILSKEDVVKTINSQILLSQDSHSNIHNIDSIIDSLIDAVSVDDNDLMKEILMQATGD